MATTSGVLSRVNVLVLMSGMVVLLYLALGDNAESSQRTEPAKRQPVGRSRETQLDFPRMGGPRRLLTRRDLSAIAVGELEKVSVSHAVLEDSVIAFLMQFPRLAIVVLEDTNLSDRDLALLFSAIECTYLNAIGTDLTDSSIGVLAEERSLKSVNLADTAVTIEGLKKLKQRRPDLDVDL